MSYIIEVSRIGDHGVREGSRRTFTASNVPEAIALGKTEVKKMQPSPRPVMFSIYDQTKRMILSYTSAVRPRLH